MNVHYQNLLRSAFNEYLLQMEGGSIEPAEGYLPYDFPEAKQHKWRLFGGEMVNDELREITNILNHWHGSLHRWHAWNFVISRHDGNDAWDLRREFVEALVHQCLLQPSSVRDTFTFVATNAIHQARLSTDPAYKDVLEGDPVATDSHPKALTRRKKENRLARLVPDSSNSISFLSTLCLIDDATYKELTSDYRNRAAHSIAPRLALGITRALVRRVVPDTTTVKQPNGTFEVVDVPGKMAVVYEYGGTAPLDLEHTRVANLDQYRRARKCFECYLGTLRDAMAGMPAKQ